MGEWLSSCAFVVVDEALGRDPAHALDETADHLTAVDARIDRAANVNQDVDARDGQLAGEAIDLDFGNRGALRVIEEWIAATGLAVVVDAGRGVETVGAEIDRPIRAKLQSTPNLQRWLGLRRSKTTPSSKATLSSVSARPSSRLAKRREANAARRSLICLAALTAAAPLRSVPAEAAVGEVFAFLSVCVGITMNSIPGDAKFVGHELANLGVEPLPHFRAAGGHLNRAVGENVDQAVPGSGSGS